MSLSIDEFRFIHVIYNVSLHHISGIQYNAGSTSLDTRSFEPNYLILIMVGCFVSSIFIFHFIWAAFREWWHF